MCLGHPQRLPLCKLHKLERRATIWAVGVAKRFTYFKMIIVWSFNQLDGLARCLYCSGKIAALPLKLRGFVGAISDDNRGPQLINVSLRAHRVLHLVGEFDIGATLRKANRLQVVHSAHAKSALHSVCWKSEILLPISHQGDAAKVASRRMAADVKSIGIGSETLGILVGPGNSTPHLVGHNANVTVCRADRSKIKRDVIYPGAAEKLGCVATALRLCNAPSTAVYENKYGRVGHFCRI